MAITNINLNPSPEKGIDYTVTTDTSADWAGVANDTYFYDFGDKLPHYKNASGDILEVFSEGSTPVDVLGIADSDGVYTYYSDYTTAIVAVPIGGTIEQFGDIIETGSVVIAITKSVNIQMNGYSYTLDNVDGTHAFTVSGASAKLVKINNGTINRKNGTGRTLQVISSNALDVVDLTGTIITNENNNNWLLVGLTGIIIGGTYLGSNGIGIESSAKFSNFTYEGSGILQVKGTAIATKGYVNSSNATYAVTLGDSNAVVSFLEVKATVNVGIWSIGNIHNCNIEAVGYGVYSYGSDSKVTGTHAYSSGSLAFYLDAGQIINCEGYSDGNSALLIQGGATNGTMAKGCYFKSSAKYAIWIGNNGANIYDCYVECTLNSTVGHGIGFTSNAVSRIVDCTVKTANVGANALNGIASGFVTGLVSIGMTTSINPTFTVNQDATHIITGLVQHATQTAIIDSDLIEESINFHMDGSSLAGRYKDNLGVVTDIQFGTPTDVLGIADTDGVYTYYSDYSSAMASAVSGDTIEQFGNIIETGSVTITLKDRVRINMNGYKYQHINDDNIATFSSTVAITTKISNGTIIRNRTTGGSGIPLLQSTNADSVFDLTGVKLLVENCRAFWSQGTIIGCTVEAGGTLTAGAFFYGSLYGVTFISNDYQSIIYVGGSGTVTKDCTFISKALNGRWGQWTVGSGGKIINCYFESNTTASTLITAANTEYNYCNVVQLGSGVGITTSATGIVFNHCSSKSVSGRAYSGGGYAIFNNCVGFSESGQCVATGGGSIWNNCTLTTNSGSEVVHTFTEDNGFYNCVLTNNGTDSTSYAITSRNSDNASNYIVGCTLITASTTSPIMNIGGTNVNHFVYLADNKFKGGIGYTLPVTGNSVSPNNVDVYGNIQLT